MKVYFDYKGEIPTGVQVMREGIITRIYFDYATEEKEMNDENVTFLTAENVDIEGAVEYGKIVSAIVRDRYTADDVEAILANFADKGSDETYEAFQSWRNRAKEIAHAVTD